MENFIFCAVCYCRLVEDVSHVCIWFYCYCNGCGPSTLMDRNQNKLWKTHSVEVFTFQCSFMELLLLMLLICYLFFHKNFERVHQNWFCYQSSRTKKFPRGILIKELPTSNWVLSFLLKSKWYLSVFLFVCLSENYWQNFWAESCRDRMTSLMLSRAQ